MLGLFSSVGWFGSNAVQSGEGGLAEVGELKRGCLGLGFVAALVTDEWSD